MSSSRVTRRNRRRDSPETETSQSAFPQQPHQTHASPPHPSPPAAPLPPHAAAPSPRIALHLRSSHLIASQAGGESANLAGADRTSPVPRPQPKRFLKLRLTVNHQKQEGLQGKRQAQTRKHGRGSDKEEVDSEKGRDKENLVCVTEFMREEDYTALGITMPSLEATPGKKRRASSGLSREKPKQLTNGVGGSHRGATTSNSNGTVHKSELATSTSTSTNKHKQKKEDLEKSLERNIDTVIFGDVSFKAWYPSWYPKEIIGEKALDGKGAGITVTELYVCERCFGYAKTLLEWVRHCRCCERGVPGQRIYVHGSGEGEIDEDKRHWEVWEVDGEVETLFCQNLSLFAKLFLDNKSVFFDVSGFNYFLLVYVPPSTVPSSSQSPQKHPQIVGFFSKEKQSWDNNNLACILIFPPWQKKSLGSLLMGVSYEIARREGILGGPEKPISDLGKKGYKRFWGAEIARWLLQCKETDRKKGKGMVDVERISKETWIMPEDALVVLREMGVVEKAGRGKGTVERVRVDKVAVRDWVAKQRLSLERVVDRDGFVEGYGYKDVEEEEEEVEEEEEEMEVD